jgi:tetratricopeptide (TPR) repeat protein
MAYERDRFRECRDAFRRLVELDASSGAAWALKGLCEFGLASYADARGSLDRALQRGGLPDATLLPVVLYHQALLRIRAAEYEPAIPLLTELATASPETADLVAACGLVLLRRPLLPAEVAPADSELVARSGRAYCAYLARRAGEARARFAELLAAYPTQEHLHYGFGLFPRAAGRPGGREPVPQGDRAHPGHVLAHLGLRGAEAATRRERSRRRARPRSSPRLVRRALWCWAGRSSKKQLGPGIRELELAARLAPDVRETHRALASAYERAGRKLDAERARGTVRKLDNLDEARRARAAAEAAEPAKP